MSEDLGLEGLPGYQALTEVEKVEYQTLLETDYYSTLSPEQDAKLAEYEERIGC